MSDREPEGRRARPSGMCVRRAHAGSRPAALLTRCSAGRSVGRGSGQRARAARRAGVGLALVALLLSGCGDDVGTVPAPHAEVRAETSEVRLVDEARADLVLYVSNQSFDDENVHLHVAVDGVTVVDAAFAVEGQHNWIQFPLALAPGRHELTAVSDTGATLREPFVLPVDAPGYAVVDHWGKEGSAELTWLFQQEPVGFD